MSSHDGRQPLLGRVTGAVTGKVVEAIDPDVVLAHVDIDALLDRVDLDAVLARVDPNELLDRVDVQRLLDRVDVDALLTRVDIEALVARSGIPDIVAASTGRLAVSALDLARAQVRRLDAVIDHVIGVVLRRTFQAGYAGLLSRALAALADIGIATLLFTVGYAGAEVLLDAFFGVSLSGDDSAGWSAAVLAVWSFLYSVVALTLTGYTPGKRLLGIRVLSGSGRTPELWRAVVRTALMPVSGVLLGLGYLVAVVDRRHRGLHDLVAGTAVVYDRPVAGRSAVPRS